MKKIAVVGSGISGHVVAHQLRDLAKVTLYESESRFGGHANTVTINGTPVDTGFIVYNELNYPGLVNLFKELNVPTVETDMSFGTQDLKTGIQYSTQNINGVFAQRKNLFNPKYLKVWSDFFKLKTYAEEFLKNNPHDITTTVGDLCREAGCGKTFKNLFLYAMAGAIWSTAPEEIDGYPARSFLQFMVNHRMLQASGQPIWRTVVGGSKEYVKRLSKFSEVRRLSNSAVQEIKRVVEGVSIKAKGHESEIYDEVIVATHSDQALKIIDKPSQKETEVLSSIKYQPNQAILHSDLKMMPSEKRAWAAWNVCLPKTAKSRIELTYDMNRLQHLTGQPWLITLNPHREIAEEKIHKTIDYMHPFFDLNALKAQERWSEVSGVDRIHYCGAYWKWGFHEDGVWSALRVVEEIKKGLQLKAIKSNG